MSTHLALFPHTHVNTRADLICARYITDTSANAPVLAWNLLCPSDNRPFRISRTRAIQFFVLTPVRILDNLPRAITADTHPHLLNNHFSSTQILIDCTTNGK
jgi:hypothetical protein